VIVVDASVLIAHLDKRVEQHAEAVDVLLDAADQPLAASPLTSAEVLVGPARGDRLDAAVDTLAQLELQEIPFAPDAAARLAVLRASTALKLPDCCVLLAAQDGRASAILTFDDRLAREAERLGYGQSGVRPGSDAGGA
jgi:predicted nucleic acid-binding protein